MNFIILIFRSGENENSVFLTITGIFHCVQSLVKWVLLFIWISPINLLISSNRISDNRFCVVVLMFCYISYCIHVEGSKEGQFSLQPFEVQGHLNNTIFENSVHTANKTQCLSIRKIILLMMLREIITVYADSHLKPQIKVWSYWSLNTVKPD
jgi:hypothetical protein